MSERLTSIGRGAKVFVVALGVDVLGIDAEPVAVLALTNSRVRCSRNSSSLPVRPRPRMFCSCIVADAVLPAQIDQPAIAERNLLEVLAQVPVVVGRVVQIGEVVVVEERRVGRGHCFLQVRCFLGLTGLAFTFESSCQRANRAYCGICAKSVAEGMSYLDGAGQRFLRPAHVSSASSR